MKNFKLENTNNELCSCEVLFTFDLETTQKSYIVYTDYSKDENNNLKVFASCFNSSEDTSALQKVETQEELSIVDNLLHSYQEETKKTWL